MGEELDWGPNRPPAVAWGGSLLLVVSIVQLGALATASLLDGGSLLGGRAERLVAASVAVVFALQLLAAVGVLRLWRWWRGIAMVLCVMGVALQAVSLSPPPDLPVVVAINTALALVYVLVFVLLARSREAFG